MTGRLQLVRLWLTFGFVGSAVLCCACLIPDPPQLGGIAGMDKVEHLLAYVVLGAWFAAVLPGRYLQVFTGLAVFGLAIEIAQSLTGYRDGDVLDLVADMIGTAAGIGLARLGAMRWLEAVDRHVVARRNRTG